MIIFLYGPDSYRSKEKLDEIIIRYREVRKSGLNLLSLDASEVDFSDVQDALKISSMFAETKLIVLKNVSSSKKFQEDFLENVETLESLKDVVVIFENQEVDQRVKLFKALLKKCKCQEFVLLDSKQVKAWAAKEFEKYQVNINNDALELLVRSVGNNLWQLANEIQKLAHFKYAATIKKEDVEMLVSANIETNIFKTIDALAEKNKKQALYYIQQHLDSSENPLYLLSMIAYQFKNLLMVKELAEKGMMYASIVKKSGLHPFVVKKTYFLCRQFSFDELKNIYHKIFAMDADIKSGKIESETALHLLIAQI